MTLGNNDIIKCSVVWNFGDISQMVNVFHVKLSGIVGQSQTLIREDLAEYFNDLYSDCHVDFCAAVDHVRIDLFNVTDNTPEVPLPRDSGLDGADAGQPLPLQVAAAVWARTAVSRRIGRKFLPIYSEGAWDGTGWLAAAITRLEAFALKWITAFTGTNMVEVQAGAYDRSGGVLNFFIDSRVAPTARIQRRRRAGVGS